MQQISYTPQWFDGTRNYEGSEFDEARSFGARAAEGGGLTWMMAEDWLKAAWTESRRSPEWDEARGAIFCGWRAVRSSTYMGPTS